MKKFSNYYINYSNILVNAIVGFEFEFFCDKPYYKLLELLNRELNPIKTWGFRTYHSDMKPDPLNFKIEMDLSGGAQMIELVTGAMPYTDARIILLKILKLLQDNANTDEKCSIHINISFDKKSGKVLDQLNPIKLILDVDEDYIYTFFPDRENNYYAKSVKRIIPFKDYKISTDMINTYINNLELPNTKYYGINIKNYTTGRLEYRYIGGKDYQFKTREILELFEYFVLLTWNNLDKELETEDLDKLMGYLQDNISVFKKFNDYDSFIGEFPTIRLEIDKVNDYYGIKSYYNKIHTQLFDLLSNTRNLSNSIINYDTDTNKIEVVDTYVNGIFDLSNLIFIESQIFDGTYIKCEFIDCDIKKSHIENCKLRDCEIKECKLSNCHVDSDCVLENVYFCNGFFDGEMISGVFRGGTIGSNAIIGDAVKLITDEDNYFGTNLTSAVTYADNDKKNVKK